MCDTLSEIHFHNSIVVNAKIKFSKHLEHILEIKKYYSRVRRIRKTFYAENLHLYAGFHLYAGRRERTALIGQLKQDLEFII